MSCLLERYGQMLQFHTSLKEHPVHRNPFKPTTTGPLGSYKVLTFTFLQCWYSYTYPSLVKVWCPSCHSSVSSAEIHYRTYTSTSADKTASDLHENLNPNHIVFPHCYLTETLSYTSEWYFRFILEGNKLKHIKCDIQHHCETSGAIDSV